MIERIVVPLDGSLTAEAILPQVRRVLDRNDSEVLLVRAVDLVPIEAAMMKEEAVVGVARDYLFGQKEKLERAGARVRIAVRTGAPVDVILQVAQEEKATLIALATHGTTGMSRLLLGSVAEGILRKSPVPVLAVRPFWTHERVSPGSAERQPIRNLLLPVDGSDLSVMSLPGIVELAKLFEMRVVLLRVLEGSRRKTSSVEEHAEAAKQLKALARSVEQKGVEAVTLVEEGDPARRILDSINSHAIDLIAMTTHGRSGLSRVVMGSVTERVLRSATVPLLITCSPEHRSMKEPLIPARMKKEA